MIFSKKHAKIVVFIYKNIHESIGLGIKSWEFWDSLRAQKSRLLYTTDDLHKKEKYLIENNEERSSFLNIHSEEEFNFQESH